MREIPVSEMYGDVVEAQNSTGQPGETIVLFRSGRWLVVNFNDGTLRAYSLDP